MEDLIINSTTSTNNDVVIDNNENSNDIAISNNNDSKNNGDDDMNLEERMNWLRDRGVQVETVEERKQKHVVAAMNQANELLRSNNNANETDEDDVQYVLIPTDTSQPLQQLSFRPSRTTPQSQQDAGGAAAAVSTTTTISTSGDALLQHLEQQSVFRLKQAETIDIDLLRRQQQSQQQTLLASSSSGTNELPVVSDTTLRNVAEQQMSAAVETFTLVHASPSNDHTSIVLYLDEMGMMKRLPLNTRATEYCQRAGFNPPPIFYGPIYMGRMQRQRRLQQQSLPVLRHLSFVVGRDTAFDAPWLQSAMATNLQHQLELNEMTGRSNAQQQQAGVAGSDGNVQQSDDGTYSWTQTEQEIEVVVVLPNKNTNDDDVVSDATASKQQQQRVLVKFQPLQLSVLYDKQPLVSIPLFERIDVDACTWTLECRVDTQKDGTNNNDNNKNQRVVVITMEKLEEAFWPRIRD